MILKRLTLVFMLCWASLSTDAQTNIFKNRDKNHNFAPFITEDGKKIIFQSNRGGGFLLYETVFADGEWSEPSPLKSINDFCKDYTLAGGPSLTKDGNTLYFSTIHKSGFGDMDIFYSVFQNGSWQTPVAMNTAVNSSEYESFPSISPDGNLLCFVKSKIDSTKGCHSIWIAERRKDGTWKRSEPLPSSINISCEKGPRFMPNGTSIAFASNRPGGKGGYDIYVSHLKDGNWSEPENYEFLNSAEDEHFFCTDEEGALGILNKDKEILSQEIPLKYRYLPYLRLFGDAKDAENQTPVSPYIQIVSKDSSYYNFIEKPSESNQFDFGLRSGKSYIITFEAKNYESKSLEIDLQSLTEYKERPESILLKPKKKQVIINIADLETSEGVSVNISIENLDLDEEIDLDQLVSNNGKYVVNLREGNNYNIEVRSRVGYAFTKKKISVPASEVPKIIEYAQSRGIEITSISLDSLAGPQDSVNLKKPITVLDSSNSVNIAVQPLKIGAKLTLNDIFFDFNSSELKSESEKELKRVIELMEKNPRLVVQIGAHTDNVGSESFNYKLSLERAQTIKNYLTSNKVKSSGLKTKGYGFSKPVASNDTEEGRAKNRRVELTVLRR